MDLAVVVMKLAAVYPVVSPDARTEFRVSAEELLEGLRFGANHAADMFRANPTHHNWLAWIQAHAAWRVALKAEEARA